MTLGSAPPSEVYRLNRPRSERLFLAEIHARAGADGFAPSPPDDRTASWRLARAGLLTRAARLVDGPDGLVVERGFRLLSRVAATPIPRVSAPSQVCDSDERALFEALHRGERVAERRLAATYLPVAERFALRLAPRSVPRDEASAAAPEALLRALRTYDPARPASFAAHLWWCVRSVVRDLVRQYSGSAEADVAGLRADRDALNTLENYEHAGERLEFQLASRCDTDDEAGISLDVLSAELRRAAEDLADGYSLDESAERLGLSVHQVRRLRTRVREAMRRMVE